MQRNQYIIKNINKLVYVHCILLMQSMRGSADVWYCWLRPKCAPWYESNIYISINQSSINALSGRQSSRPAHAGNNIEISVVE